MKNNFAQNLRHIRAFKNITLDDLANKSTVNAKTINKYEMGVTEPSISNLINLAKALGVQLDYLVSAELKLRLEQLPVIR